MNYWVVGFAFALGGLALLILVAAPIFNCFCQRIGKDNQTVMDNLETGGLLITTMLTPVVWCL